MTPPYPVQFPDTNVVNLDRIRPADVDPRALLVRTVFGPVFQGEMPLQGRRCCFIRLGGCNRGAKHGHACSWCDASFEVSKSEWKLPETLVIEVLAKDPGCKLVVISGGEPLIQRQNLGLLIQLFQDKDILVQIESNGDYMDKFGEYCKQLGPDMVDPQLLIIVNSPKASADGRIYTVPDVSTFGKGWTIHGRFLIEDDPSSPYYNLPEGANDWVCPIWLSPITVWKRQPAGIASFWSDDLDREATMRNYFRARDVALAGRTGSDKMIGLSLQSHLLFAVE